jgi:hypothetical protein
MNILRILQVRSSLDIYWTEQHTVAELLELNQLQAFVTTGTLKLFSFKSYRKANVWKEQYI